MKLKKGGKCPSCKKGSLDKEDFLGDVIFVCCKCGWDSTDPDYQIYRSDRSTQREKTKHSPYKAGRPIK